MKEHIAILFPVLFPLTLIYNPVIMHTSTNKRIPKEMANDWYYYTLCILNKKHDQKKRPRAIQCIDQSLCSPSTLAGLVCTLQSETALNEYALPGSTKTSAFFFPPLHQIIKVDSEPEG